MKFEIACSTNINCVANMDIMNLQFRKTVGPNVKLNPARTSPTKPNQTKNMHSTNYAKLTSSVNSHLARPGPILQFYGRINPISLSHDLMPDTWVSSIMYRCIRTT